MKDKQVYCVKCKHACIPSRAAFERDRRGRLRMVGKCPHCDTKCYKYVSETK